MHKTKIKYRKNKAKKNNQKLKKNYKSWYPLVFDNKILFAFMAVALIKVGNDCLFMIAPSKRGPK